MLILKTKEDLRAFKDTLAGAPIAFIPTMGALHQGHLSLIQLAKNYTQHILVSIFVNPTQFGPNEDFSAYPRTITADCELLKTTPTTALFLPETQTIYPSGSTTQVIVPKLTTLWCGKSRPGHFDGVTNVVHRLLNLTQATHLILGEKDYQQYCIINKMIHDLSLPTTLLQGPTLREKGGLAMSSRNRYLNKNDRLIAPTLFQTLKKIQENFKNGENTTKNLLQSGRDLLAKIPEITLDYLTIVDPITLEERSDRALPNDRILIAAKIGSTRLIDNLNLM